MIDLWHPRSGCGVDCLPVPGSTPRVPAVVWLGRLLAVTCVVAGCTVLLPAFPRLAQPLARALLRCLGVRLVVRGRLPTGRALLVANHVSWLDIVLLLAVAPARLVAKHEVREWPLVGRVAAAIGTIFIDRSRPRRLPVTVAGASAALRAGHVVAAFPEGTTWCGRDAGRFRPALFQAALDAGAPVVPVTLRFQLADGGGTTAAAFLGEETVWESARRVLAVRGMVASLTLHPAVHSETGMDRRTLRTIAHSGVVHSGFLGEVQPAVSRVDEDVRMENASTEARLLVVEDDPNILELLSASLRFAGFDVATATTGSQAVAVARAGRPDLVVLDVMLPDLDGFEVIRLMRENGARTPVVFLTARDATDDKIRGLTLGGDDYVTKPFSLEELTARIRAVLRRTASSPDLPPRLTFADLELDEEGHEVWRDGLPVQLSPTEFKLLRYLMLNAGRVLSKAQILDHVWNYDFRGDDNIVESYISYLRRKIDTGEPRLIHTLRGVGYVLRKPT